MRSLEISSGNLEMHINDLLKLAVEKGASDLHMKVRRPPMLRINGELFAQQDLPELMPEDIAQAFIDIANEEQREIFARELELDFSLGLGGIGRFRVNASIQRGTLRLSLRVVPFVVPDIDKLMLPKVCKDLVLKQYGLIVVTGPTGCGKSTTLAAMIEYLNSIESRHIITIEDPIEFLYQDKKCYISQRELGSDTWSFATALKHALRQDPDVILVGEMRDLDTIATALTAAETGHLVATTLHTPGATLAIDRIIDAFPPHQQQQVRIQLSTTLLGVLYQTLIPRRDGTGRVVAVEVMIATDAIRNLIREAKTPQMMSMLQLGSREGMQTLDQALLDLSHKGLISREEALIRCKEPEMAKKSITATGIY